MAAILNAPRFKDENTARKHLESIRWPDGPVCPHCGGTERNSPLNGEAHRPGLIFCGDCRTQFTVTVGTVFEDSKIPLHKWVLATHLLCASKKGMSSKQLERMLGVTYKTAWFMSHRIRKAMEKQHTGPVGGSRKIVETDETYFGNKSGLKKPRRGRHNTDKHAIFALVERGGEARSFHVPNVTAASLKPILFGQIRKSSHLMTDAATRYWNLGKEFKAHSSVNHSQGEYVRGIAHTNTVENFFGVLKRGLIGTYQHVGGQHLQRYLSEFEFRYNNRQAVGVHDEERANLALKGISGKRLTYRRTHA
jgi:transposase-like protein